MSMIALRECQQNGYDAMVECPIGIVKMFCGTGKTRLFTKFIIDKHEPLSVIVFPRLILMNQYLKDYLTDKIWKPHWKGFKYIGICSDTETSDGSKSFTTSEDDIKNFIEANTLYPKLITITYQSLTTLVGVLKETHCNPDIVICDEAHHVTSEVNQDMLFTPPMALASSRYLFTATPTKIMLNNPMRYGAVIYDYTHRDAVNDGVCNDFVISVMISAEEVKERHIYNAIVRAAVDTNNGRVLVYHSFAETDGSSQRTSVKQFRGQKALMVECVETLKEEKGTILYKEFTCQAVTASTRDKKKVLKEFEDAPSDTLYVLHNCSVIAEGVDTKSANMCVFADPKQSYVSIVQNIGRITRIMEDENHAGCVLIPCFVDKKKYEDAQGDAEKVDEILREDMQETGNFNGILNVLAALRQEDTEMFDICLNYPKSYAPKEITHEFTRKGWKIYKEAPTITELFDKPPEMPIEEISKEIGKQLIVHTLSMENPIVKYNETENESVTIFYNDEEGIAYLMVKNDPKTSRPVSAPKRPFKMKVHQNDDAKVLWDVVECIEGEITTAFIECEVIENEDRAIEKANRFVEWKNKHGRMPAQCCKTNEKKYIATEEQLEEHRLAVWLSDMKKVKKRNETSNSGRKLYASVDNILSDNLGSDWWKNEDLEQNAIDIANKYVEWKNTHGHMPTYCLGTNGKRTNATEEQQEEHRFAQWLGCMKRAKKGNSGMTLYPSVEKILSDNLGNYWWENEDFEQRAINSANVCISWINDNKRMPMNCCGTNKQKDTATEEQLEEHRLAKWIGHMKNAKRGGAGSMKLYPSVDKLLSNNLGKKWYEDLEQKAIDCANEYFVWNNEHGHMPTECCKTKKQKATATKEELKENRLAVWISHMKQSKRGNGRMTLYPIVEKLLSDNLGNNWYEKEDLEQKSIESANALVEWKNVNKRMPSRPCDTKEQKATATEEQLKEQRLAEWIGNMKTAKKGTKKDSMKLYPSVDNILSDNLGKDWYKNEDLEQRAIDSVNEYFAWKNKYGRIPSQCCATKDKKATATEEQLKENRLARWFCDMKQAKKGKGSMKLYESVDKLLSDNLGTNWWETRDDKSETSSQKSTTKARKRQPIKEPSESDEKHGTGRVLTLFEKFHQVFKRMKGKNYANRMKENPAEWHEYHTLAKKYDSKDATTPINKITASLQAVKKGRKAIDLGCGLNELAPKNAHLKWTAVDVVAVDESVHVADLTNLPYEDETYHVAILCRAMWAIDRDKVLSEAMRVLVEGGQLIIVESFRAWWNTENELMTLIKEAGFDIIDENGTVPDRSDDVFQYIIAMKPIVNIKI